MHVLCSSVQCLDPGHGCLPTTVEYLGPKVCCCLRTLNCPYETMFAYFAASEDNCSTSISSGCSNHTMGKAGQKTLYISGPLFCMSGLLQLLLTTSRYLRMLLAAWQYHTRIAQQPQAAITWFCRLASLLPMLAGVLHIPLTRQSHHHSIADVSLSTMTVTVADVHVTMSFTYPNFVPAKHCAHQQRCAVLHLQRALTYMLTCATLLTHATPHRKTTAAETAVSQCINAALSTRAVVPALGNSLSTKALPCNLH